MIDYYDCPNGGEVLLERLFSKFVFLALFALVLSPPVTRMSKYGISGFIIMPVSVCGF